MISEIVLFRLPERNEPRRRHDQILALACLCGRLIQT